MLINVIKVFINLTAYSLSLLLAGTAINKQEKNCSTTSESKGRIDSNLFV